MRSAKTVWIFIALLFAVVAFCGCGSGNSGAREASASLKSPLKDPKVAALVPRHMADGGTVVVAMDPGYPPNEYLGSDGHTIIGLDVDIANALGAVMGVNMLVKKTPFEKLLPGLARKQHDLAMSFSDSKEREVTNDMVTYLRVGSQFYTTATGGTQIVGLADLCGLRVAAEQYTTQATAVGEQNRLCKAAGKPAITSVTSNPDEPLGTAVSNGRADVGLLDSPAAMFAIKHSNGKLVSTGAAFGEAPFALTVAKGDKLAPALLAAMKALIATGHYQAILKKWSLEENAITTPKINAAP